MQQQAQKESVGRKMGLSEDNISQIAQMLSKLLADIHVLYVKTLGCHWNIVDPRFFFLHEMLEQQYKALAEEGDMVAERIRKLGEFAPASLEQFLQLTTQGEIAKVPDGDAMIHSLLDSYEQLISMLRKEIDSTTNFNDFGTADMLTELLRSFEKRAWMLRSHL